MFGALCLMVAINTLQNGGMNRLSARLMILFAQAALLSLDTMACPSSNARAVFVVADENGRHISGAIVTLSLRSQNQATSRSTGPDGRVAFDCLRDGGNYTATVMAAAHLTTKLTWRVSTSDGAKAIHLARAPGRYVLVRNGSESISGASVLITDANGQVQQMDTDQDGFAHYSILTADGAAMFEVELPGFITHRVRISRERKNGPVLIELPLSLMCERIAD